MSDGYDFTPPPPPGGHDQHATPSPHREAATASSAGTPDSGSSRAKRTHRTNGRWVFVVMVSAIALIVGGIAWASVLAYRTSAVTPAAQTATGMLHTSQVVSGMCIKNAPDLDAEPSTVNVVACSEPHHAEALVAYTFTSSQWPGGKDVADEVLGFCSEQASPDSPAIPRSPEAPAFEWHAWLPTAATWELGDRAGLCVVTTQRPVVGSYGAGTAQDVAGDAIVG